MERGCEEGREAGKAGNGGKEDGRVEKRGCRGGGWGMRPEAGNEAEAHFDKPTSGGVQRLGVLEGSQLAGDHLPQS